MFTIQTNSSIGYWQQSFGGFVSGTSGALTSMIGTQITSQSTTFLQRTANASQISMLVKTKNIFHDNQQFEAVYVLRDANDRSQVNVSTAAVHVDINYTDPATNSAVTNVFSSVCSAPDSVSGVGKCRFDNLGLDVQTHFSTSQDAFGVAVLTLFVSGQEIAQVSDLIVLDQRPSFTDLGVAGMVVSMIQSPVFAGDTFGVSVQANTGLFDLKTWGMNVVYDASVLQVVSVTLANSKFNSPTVTTSEIGVVSMVTTSKTDAVVTGSNVDLIVIQFAVLESVTSGTHANVINCTVRDMVNTGGFKYVDNQAAQIHDIRGGAQTSGTLLVRDAVTVGVYAYAPTSEIVNLAALNSASFSSNEMSITAVRVSNRFGDTETDITGLANCTLDDKSNEAVVSVSDLCTVTTTATHTNGTAAASVTVGFNNFNFAVVFRVWYPVSVQVVVSDDELNVISDATGVCTAARQTADAYALVTLSAGPSLLIQDLDMSDFVSWTAHNQLVQVDKTRNIRVDSSSEASILQAGGASDVITIQSYNHNGVSVAAANVSLPAASSNQTVSVVSLYVSAVTDFVWSNVPQVIDSDRFTAYLSLEQILTKEGQEASLYVTAVFSDGAHRDVSSESGIIVSSRNAYQVTVTEGSHANRTVVVATGAETTCGSMLAVEWQATTCNTTNVTAVLGTGVGVVQVNLPSAISVTVTTSHSRLTRPGDVATATGIELPTQCTVSVVVVFADGSSENVELDSRTVLTVVTGSSLASLNGTTLTSTQGASGGTVVVSVSFPSRFPALKANATVQLVVFQQLQLASSPFPVYSGSNPTTVLRTIHCTSSYQRAVVSVGAVMSDGSKFDVTNHSSLTSSDSQIVRIAGTTSQPILVGTLAGNVSISASYATVSTASTNNNLAISVVSDRTFVSLIQLLSLPSSNTLTGSLDTTHRVVAQVSFDDGTVFPDSVFVASQWFSIADIIAFASSQSSIMSVNENGDLQLLGNYNDVVALTVSATQGCGSGTAVPSAVATTAGLYCNLKSSSDGDVDLGNIVGAPFPSSLAVGNTFTVGVRLQSSASAVLAFQIVLEFDSAVIQAQSSSCAIGSDWSGDFECTLNNPPTQILLLGSASSSTAQGNDVSIASFTIVGIAAGTSIISGSVAKLETADGQLCSASSPCAIVAGVDIVTITAGSVKHDLATTKMLVSTPIVTTIAHRKAIAKAEGTCTENVLGDTNNDCMFDISDVLLTQQYYTGQNVGPLSASQLSKMTPTMRGSTPDGVDIQYLLSVLARKWRFLETPSSSVVNSTLLSVQMSVLVADQSSLPAATQTKVLFEIGTQWNRNATISVGTFVQTTDNGVLVQAAQISTSGVYTVTCVGPFSGESSVGLVVLIETTDSFGQQATDRRFPFYGTTVAPYDASGFSFTPYTTFDFLSTVPSSSATPSPSSHSSATQTPSASPSVSPSTSAVLVAAHLSMGVVGLSGSQLSQALIQSAIANGVALAGKLFFYQVGFSKFKLKTSKIDAIVMDVSISIELYQNQIDQALLNVVNTTVLEQLINAQLNASQINAFVTSIPYAIASLGAVPSESASVSKTPSETASTSPTPSTSPSGSPSASASTSELIATSSSQSSSTGIAVGGSVGGAMLVAGATALIVMRSRKRRRPKQLAGMSLPIDQVQQIDDDSNPMSPFSDSALSNMPNVLPDGDFDLDSLLQRTTSKQHQVKHVIQMMDRDDIDDDLFGGTSDYLGDPSVITDPLASASAVSAPDFRLAPAPAPIPTAVPSPAADSEVPTHESSDSPTPSMDSPTLGPMASPTIKSGGSLSNMPLDSPTIPAAESPIQERRPSPSIESRQSPEPSPRPTFENRVFEPLASPLPYEISVVEPNDSLDSEPIETPVPQRIATPVSTRAPDSPGSDSLDSDNDSNYSEPTSEPEPTPKTPEPPRAPARIMVPPIKTMPLSPASHHVPMASNDDDDDDDDDIGFDVSHNPSVAPSAKDWINSILDSDSDASEPDDFSHAPELPPIAPVDQMDLLREASMLAPGIHDRPDIDVSDSDGEVAPIMPALEPVASHARVVPPIPLNQPSFRGLTRRRKDSDFVAAEAHKAFELMDEDGDGFITDAELVQHFKVSRMEARAIIDEIEQVLHGKRQDGRLNVEEFTIILENSVKDVTVSKVPEKQQKRYRQIFDSMDTDGNGVVTTEEFAKGLGIDTAEFGMESLTFDQFVEVMSRAEQSSAYRTLAQLLTENESFPELSRALSRLRKRTLVKRGQTGETDWSVDPPAVVKQIWQNVATPDPSAQHVAQADPESALFTSGRADLSAIRQALQQSLLQGTLMFDDDQGDDPILKIVFDLEGLATTSSSSANPTVTFTGFAKVMQSVLSSGNDQPMLTDRSGVSSYSGSDAQSGMDSARSVEMTPAFARNISNALLKVAGTSSSGFLQQTMPGIHASIKSAFDKCDSNHDGLLDREEAIQALTDLDDLGLVGFDDENAIEFTILNVMGDNDTDVVTFDMFVQIVEDYS